MTDFQREIILYLIHALIALLVYRESGTITVLVLSFVYYSTYYNYRRFEDFREDFEENATAIEDDELAEALKEHLKSRSAR